MKQIFFIITSVILLISVIISASLSSENQPSNAHENLPQPVTYVLKEYDGKIAVFENDADIPFRITDVYVKNLPQEDRLLLCEGIHAENDSELALLLEDYCS